MTNLASILQQLQQLQLQQKTVAASVNSLGASTVYNLMQDLRSQQESLINQLALNPSTAAMAAAVAAASNSNSSNASSGQNVDPAILDPAILGAANPGSKQSQSIWDVPCKV